MHSLEKVGEPQVLTSHYRSIKKNAFGPLIPYLAVGIGLLILHNGWIAMLGYHAGMVVFTLLSRKRYPFRQAWKSGSVGIPAAASFAGLLTGVVLYILLPLLHLTANSTYLENASLTVGQLPVFLAYFLVVNPVLEEYYWRGCLGSGFRRPVLNDAMFAGYHVMVLAGLINIWLVIAAFVALTFLGWLWRQVDRLAGGLLPSCLSHFALDTSIMMVLYFAVIL